MREVSRISRDKVRGSEVVYVYQHVDGEGLTLEVNRKESQAAIAFWLLLFTLSPTMSLTGQPPQVGRLRGKSASAFAPVSRRLVPIGPSLFVLRQPPRG